MSNFPAGSKIIITNPVRGESYKKGDIFEVIEQEGSIGVNAECNGLRRYISNSEFVAYAEPFKVGDKVEVTANNAEWEYKIGTVGTVTHIDSDEPKIRLGDAGYIFTEDLKRVPEEPLAEWEKELPGTTPRTITFADIQKGDLIKAEFTPNGVKRTHEGIADSFSYGDWYSAEGDYVAKVSWGATYTLLERPKPNPFAEAKVGSIATYCEEGIKYLKTGDDAWAPISQKGTLPDYHNSDESMTNCGDLIQVTHNA